MKYFTIIVFLTTFLFGTDLGWINSYEKALVSAKAQNKLVYVLITSDYCGWCRKFEATTLQDEDIKKRLNKEFITVQLSRERDEIPKQFETTPVPRHYFTKADGEIVYSSLGYRKFECFYSFMDNAQNKVKVSK